MAHDPQAATILVTWDAADAAKIMTGIDWLIVAAYLAITVSIGRYFARRQRNTEDFYLGGGRLPWLAVALSVVASLASTVGYLGTPGEVIKNGIGMLVSTLAMPLSMLVTVFVIVPFYRRAGVTTAFELLGQRYGTSTRVMGVIIWAYMQIAFLGLVLLLASRLISAMTDVPEIYVILTIGVACVLYTSAGGMQSVVWTEVLQFMILCLGAFLTLGVVASRTGTGLSDWWQEISGQTHNLPPLFSYDLATRHTIVGMLLFGLVVNVSYASSEQVVVQRYGTTRRAIAMMITNYFAGAMFTLLQFVVGAALLVFYLRMPELLPQDITTPTDTGFADDAFPYFIVHHMPVGITGIVMAALLGAAQSSMGSGINSMAAVISTDVLPMLGYEAARENQLKTARWSTRAVGAGVVFMAVVANNLPKSNNIIDIAQKVVHLGLGPMGAIFLITMLVSKISTAAANIAILAGMLSAAFFAFHEPALGWELISPLLIIPASFFVTFVLAPLLGLALRSRN